MAVTVNTVSGGHSHSHRVQSWPVSTIFLVMCGIFGSRGSLAHGFAHVPSVHVHLVRGFWSCVFTPICSRPKGSRICSRPPTVHQESLGHGFAHGPYMLIAHGSKFDIPPPSHQGKARGAYAPRFLGVHSACRPLFTPIVRTWRPRCAFNAHR